MWDLFSENFTGIFLFFCILHDLSYRNISIRAVSYNSSEEIRNIFSFSRDTNSVLQGLSGRQNVSSSSYNSTKKKNYNSLQTSSIKTFLPTKLIETGSDLFLGVPEVIHINGTSSIKPRKGVHYSKIVPNKGLDNENEAFHVPLEFKSCFQLIEKDYCYNNTGVDCSCCIEDNILGKNFKQNPVDCKSCKTFHTLTTEGNQTCKNICCKAINNNFLSVTQSSYINYPNYQTEQSTEKKLLNLSLTKIFGKIVLDNNSSGLTERNENNLTNLRRNSKFKPQITKVPYDSESRTELLDKVQERFFVPLAVSLFFLPLLGVVIFFLWQRGKKYWNKRYYRRMDFLIDGIYND